MTYHVAYLTNDVESPMFGDIAIHEGTSQECNRCVSTWAGYLERLEDESEA